ncbi:hypothetical protein Hanom_Chr15g01380011 [Helianthus anomalus]
MFCFVRYFSVIGIDLVIKVNNNTLSKLQVLSFIYVSNCRRCPLPLKLTSFVVKVSKSCTLHPLALTKLIFFG